MEFRIGQIADRREAAERLARERGWDGISAERVFEMPSIFIGSVDQIVVKVDTTAQEKAVVFPTVARNRWWKRPFFVYHYTI